MVQRPQPVPQPQPIEPIIQGQPEVIMVDRNDNVDEVVRNVQQQNIGAHNNITSRKCNGSKWFKYWPT